MKTIILGFDAFDPTIFERLLDQGRMPNLSRYVDIKGYKRLIVSNPPQSEVSWTSIATGLNPGGHGIFDFVHRDPKTYTPFVSLLPTTTNVLGTKFESPTRANTFFDHAAKNGYPATSLWWPVTFPPRMGSPVYVIPGLGTPDILGKLGVGTQFSTEQEAAFDSMKTRVEFLDEIGSGRFKGSLQGPLRKRGRDFEEIKSEFTLDIENETTASIHFEECAVKLILGEWSPIVELKFRLGLFMNVSCITRIILTQIHPSPILYILPLQLHPMRAMWDYSAPKSFAKNVWQECGPYLSLGWPQDTTALEEGCINDDQFLDLCESIFSSRKRTLLHLLKGYREGILGCVFDSLDRIQHMFWKEDPFIIEGWYEKLDHLVGEVEQQLAESNQEDVRIIILSDHGFTDFDFKVNLNQWLIENGYIYRLHDSSHGDLRDINWDKSTAYAVGLNSIYVNLYGREVDGCVDGSKIKVLVDELCRALQTWHGPNGTQVVSRAYTRPEAFQGPSSEYGPDILVGYSPGYRASQATGLGQWGGKLIEVNNDHWNGDHCVDNSFVSGVLFCNSGLGEFSTPSYRDIPVLAVNAELDSNISGDPPSLDTHDREMIEDRLKSLGYL